MIIKTGLSNVSSGISRAAAASRNNPESPKIGKVFGIITTENTPTKELFETNGGWNGIGTIFYLNYDKKTKDICSVDLNKCKPAKPF